MGSENFTIDQLEHRILARLATISRLQAESLTDLEELDSRQVATGDGCRNLSEWAAARFDLGLETARSMVRTMRRTVDRPWLREALGDGLSWDRVQALSRIPDDVGALEHLDVAGVRHTAALKVRVTAASESRTAIDRFLVLQPSLDESWWKLWGGLDGVSGAIVDKVITERADQLPDFPDGSRGDAGWRKATALVDLAITDDPPPARVTVFVDAAEAVSTNAETGIVLESGPRAGPRALGAILCDAVAELTVIDSDGRFIEYGTRSRTVPPALRRAVLHRDQGRCAADGCDSRHRLQAHHIQPWSEGGVTDAGNLITLCWFHHHVVVHEWGYRLFRHPDHGRVRFRRPDIGSDPP